ncbi:glycosyltransferase family 1 protein [Psychromonas sp. MB-3u-54]|uniref:glycosyltransferase family 4 protein n=1 Tax=Psychromonas sp. MB-3u-54 TaxID=2058319 RepID=UPI000C31D987|nr:glycosyltransferase family 4 protein [Psychromonas sp. MB-3u-54]PKH03415.1 glycosyltransferase family 1 protein [Psychromonas sp. MB-3u-54]
MSNTLKVAHLQLLPLVTGVQRVTLDELERLVPEHFTPYIICKEPGPMTEEAEGKGIICLYSESLRREVSPKNDLLAFWQLYRLFRKHRFHVVHSHSSKTGVLGRVAAKLAGVPMITHTVHGFAFPAANSTLEKWVFLAMEWLGTKCSDKIICLHEADREIAKNKLGASDAQLEVLANGVDTTKYAPASIDRKLAMRQALGIPSDAVIVGMVGRLWRQKNPQAFVNAAINLLSQGVNTHFFLVGDGELKMSLEEAVKQAGFTDNIHFLGWRNDTPQILKALDVFVLPSLWEGMPLAILEAQSTGLPCVVSNIQGNNHLVTAGKDGLLFELDKPQQLSDKIKLLIDDKLMCSEFSANARNKVLDKYCIDKRIENMAALYLANNNISMGEVNEKLELRRKS